LRVDGHAEQEQNEQQAKEYGGGLQAPEEAAPALAGGVVKDE
jgi:hypothetical protein